jgi:hypothetical protein
MGAAERAKNSGFSPCGRFEGARLHPRRERLIEALSRGGTASEPAEEKTTPRWRRQVHPTARSLSSHRVLPVQLNAKLQLLSTVSDAKTALHPRVLSLMPKACAAAPLLFGKRAATPSGRDLPRAIKLAEESGFSPCGSFEGAQLRNLREKSPPLQTPGSPHSKRLTLTPCASSATECQTPTP